MSKSDKTQPNEATQDVAPIDAQVVRNDTELAEKEEQEKADAAAKKAMMAANLDSESLIKKEGRKILDDYPTEQEVYMTSDGFGFFREHDAYEHSKRLDNKDIVLIKRKQ